LTDQPCQELRDLTSFLRNPVIEVPYQSGSIGAFRSQKLPVIGKSYVTHNVQERYIYDPYGSVTILTANWTSRGSSNYGWVFLHQGGRLDNATGLYNFRNRDFSPTLGRWMSNDPIGYSAGDTNLYRDESNDPVNRRDPLGLIDYSEPPTGSNPLGPGDLVVLSCQRMGKVDFFETCKTGGYAVGKYATGGRGGNALCAGDLTQLCNMITKCRPPKGKWDRITLVGHCGGSNQKGPGVMLWPSGGSIPFSRFQNPGLPDFVKKCISDNLAPSGVFTICSCGYRNGGILNPDVWDDQLSYLAIKLGRTVCACPGDADEDPRGGCRCLTPPTTPGGRPSQGDLPKICRRPPWLALSPIWLWPK
jgi:RHS repeat-associated protein